jgi:hypothetical protein
MCLPIHYLAINYSGFQVSRHIAPSLRLFIPNDLQAYCNLFFSEGCACNVCDRFHLPSCGSGFPWCLLSNRSCCSTFKGMGSLTRQQSVQVFHYHPTFTNRWGKKYLGWPVLLHLLLLLVVLSLVVFRRGLTPPQCPATRLSQPIRNPDYLLYSLQPDGFPEDPAWCSLTIQM